jgi:asparagine synthase (glutamine-hydrolysing)
MCGIAGLMMRDGSAAEQAVLERMAAAMHHRGPDGSGYFRGGAVGLVSTRLAIIDLKTGDQPLYEDGGAVLVANGEIYNDPELRAGLQHSGFRTGSDCESPLQLYCKKGLDFALELRGMYGIAIYDAARKRLVLSRDSFGIKPLYYVANARCFAFASEPQVLIAAGLARREIRPHKCHELLQLKFTTGRETIFADVQRILPGETLVVEDARIVERRRRPALPAGGAAEIDDGGAARALDGVLADSVAHHLRSDVPYGLFLSSGIDSSALIGLMTRLTPAPVVAFTVGFPGSQGKDERLVAERVAKSLGADHHVIEMTERDFWTLAPRVAAAVDDPTTDAATLPTFALGAAAKGRLKVVLSGEGADEIFGGYARYRRARWLWGLLSRNAHRHGEFDEFASMGDAFGGWRNGLGEAEAREDLAERSRLQRLQAVDCAEWLPNDLLIKLDRCLMAHSVEGRTPYLDPVVADFAFRLPDRLKVTAKFGKRLLRDWLARNVPAAEPYARKTGFNPPIGRWIAARKADLASLVAGQPGIAAMVTKDDVSKVYAAPDQNAQAAWSLLFYALWHSHHVLEVAPGGAVDETLAAAARLG